MVVLCGCVAPRVFRAPRVLCGPGRCVCRWAAARPRAVRAASFARRVVSKPGQSLPPPTGTAAGPSGALHASGSWCADRFGASARSPASPCRRPPAPRQVPPPPSGTAVRSCWHSSHQWGWVADRRVVSKPGQAPSRSWAPRPGPAATHGHCSQTLLAPSTPVGPGVLVGGGPPASRPRRELCSVRPLEASPGPEAISAISHVIPLRLVQTLNLHRWNCNVFVWSRKVTVGNYVRLLVSAGPPAAFCAAAGPASRSPPMPSGTLLWCARCGEEALFWIGTALLDSLLTYPERNNLSRLLFPIQFGGVCQPGGLLAAWQWGVCAMRSLLVARRRRVGGLDGAIPPFGDRLV